MKSLFKLLTYFVAVFLILGGAEVFASATAKTDLIKLPKNVYQAIRTNDKIGRIKWDKYSIYRVRTFEILNSTETNLESVVSEVMRKTRFDYESAFGNFCEYEFETNNWEDCAKGFVVSHRVENDFVNTVEQWVQVSTNPTNDEKLFKDSVNTILKYFEVFLATQEIYEFRAMTDYDSAATYTTIIISKDLRKAIVVARNETGIVL